MTDTLLTAEEIKCNAKLRKLILEFMNNDEDIPEEVFDHLIDMKRESRLLAPVEANPENMEKFRNSGDEDVTFDVDMKLISDDDGKAWIPLFTSEEAAEDDDPEDACDLLPFFIEDIFDQINESEDISGVVIDPWTNGFPIPNEVAEDLFDDENDPDAAEINLVRSGIEVLDTDCIVNSANNTLIPGPYGIDRDINDAAGEGLAAECRTLRGCKTGEAKITDAYDLSCDYVIHTVGPIYSGKPTDADDLADCYDNCLYTAREHGLHSIAFPCISTGYFGYPKEDACDIAVQAVMAWLSDNDDYDIDISHPTKSNNGRE